jgi:PAS domain S-box-containing protein
MTKRFLARLGIGGALALAFGALAALTVLVVVSGFFAARSVTRDIAFVEDARAPASLTSAQAQASLLRMQLHLRGYLVLGDPQDIAQYLVHKESFERHLAALQSLATTWRDDEARQVARLTRDYAQWVQLPQKLFELHDDPLKNREALRLSRLEVQPRRVEVLSQVDALIGPQKEREPSTLNRELLSDLVGFQTSFDAMATNLMAYAASGESSFKLSYGPQLATNAALWRALSEKRASLTPEQRARFDVIAARRAELGELALQIVNLIAGDRAYEDRYLYRTEAAPRAQDMLRLLEALTTREQTGLQADLARARKSLNAASVPAILGGLLAIALAIVLAVGSQRRIVGPVRKLTVMAEQLAAGDLSAAADVESNDDEIGRLAQMINTRLRKEELQQLMASVSDCLWRAEIAPDGTFTHRYISPALERIAGVSPERLLGSPQLWFDRLHPDDRAALVAQFERIKSGATDRIDTEYRIALEDGSLRWVRDSVRAARLGDGRIVLNGVISDITERKHAEEELRARQEMLDLAQKAARAIAFEWRIGAGEGRNRWSPDLEAMYGVPAGSYDGSYESWKKLVHPGDWPSVKAAIEHAMATGDVVAEYRVVHTDGSTRRLQAKGRMLFGADGSPSRLIGFMLDVTEQRHVEEEMKRLERQLTRTQRLEALGTLAGGIAHDFNNILGAILGYGEMALRDVPAGTRMRRDIDSMIVAGERGRALVERILAFSRSGMGERVAVNVEAVVLEALHLLAGTLPANVKVETSLAAGPAAMVGDPSQVHQVLTNLATNAVQAMPDGGRLRVILAVEKVDQRRIATIGLLDPGEYIALTVSDTGCGIAPEVLDRIFDPFFTTKDVAVGTGLGLSLVHGIVAEVGGAIDVASTPGAGSRFTVYLPRRGDAHGAGHRHESDIPRGEDQRILVVDDEEALVDIATRTLQDLGYTPAGFHSSAAALAAFLERPAEFDALVTDERMPGLSGTELIREVRAVRPELPIVMMSGYLSAAALDGNERGADAVLRKPVGRRDLAASLARVLARDAFPAEPA